jgi:methionine aminotransferase
MSALAQQHNAINLSQGFPDFPIDEQLVALVTEAMQQGRNQYAPMPGLPLLRNAIAQDFAQRYGLSIDPETEITITPGATYAIYTAFTSILQACDEVIVLEPAYDSYIPNIEMNGARPVPVRLQAPLFRADWHAVKQAVTTRTKAIIVNTPHNPTGTVWAKEDWDHLAAIVADTNIFILSDEVYEQLVYDGRKHYSVLQHKALRQRSFALFSFGKAFHNTGWKVGYCIAPPALTTAFRRVHQYLSFSVNTPVQQGLAVYLGLPGRPDAAMLLQQKRDYFLGLLKDMPFSIHAPAAGSYFQLAGYSDISKLPDRQAAEWLTAAHGVATIPVSAFYSSGQDEHLLRFCFAKKEETLAAAVERLRRLS